jgi:peroxiredoxin
MEATMSDRGMQGMEGMQDRPTIGAAVAAHDHRAAARGRAIAVLAVAALLVSVVGAIAGCAPVADQTPAAGALVAGLPTPVAPVTGTTNVTDVAVLGGDAAVTITATEEAVAADGAVAVTTTDGAPQLGVLPGPAIAPEGTVVDLPPRQHALLGQPAPDFTMDRLDGGEPVSLSGLKGKPVVLNFWATWCPPCRLEMPWLQNAYNAHQAEGLTVLAVDAGEKVPPDMVHDQVARFVEDAGLTFPMLLGDNTYEVQKQWSVLGLPATFLVDSEGKVVDFHGGAFPNQATFEDWLQAILAPEGGDS